STPSSGTIVWRDSYVSHHSACATGRPVSSSSPAARPCSQSRSVETIGISKTDLVAAGAPAVSHPWAWMTRKVLAVARRGALSSVEHGVPHLLGRWWRWNGDAVDRANSRRAYERSTHRYVG